MIKKLRVTVDGKSYDVSVEIPDESADSAAPPPNPISTPSAPPPPATVFKTSAAPGDVPSPLMGRVVAIDVKRGQEVTEGLQLLTIETMKMNTFVLAPKAGKVTEILITVGDAVEEGRLLVRID